MVNKVILVGRLGKEPELKYTPKGDPVCTFTLATSSLKDKTEWHNITSWKSLAEICAKFLKKGSLIYCEGRIENQSWEKDGQKHNKTEIVINDMKMLDKKKDSDVQTEINDKDVPF